MKLFENATQKRKAVVAFLVIAASVVFTLGMINIFPIFAAIRKFFLLFVPFYIGFAVAYLLNPLLKFFEQKVFKRIKKQKIKRIISVIIVYVILLAFLAAVCMVVLPALVSSVLNLASNVQNYYDIFTDTVDKVLERYPVINDYYERHAADLNDAVYGMLRALTTYLTDSIPKIVEVTSQVSGTIVQVFIGLIISVYFLLRKEQSIQRLQRIMQALFPEETCARLTHVAKVTDVKTGRFIFSRIIDSLIMTVLCFALMSLFRFPFPLLNSIIIGVFNLIPVFGSIVSAIPTAFIVLITKPSAFLYYILFIIIIQQFDGNILGPKIQGDQLGISALWIMFAVLLFGGLFGVFGMIIGVPIFAVIYYFADEAIEARLINMKKDDVPTEPA